MRYLTDTDVAEQFGISKEQVQRRCAAGQWPHMRVGKAYRFKAEHVAAIEALCEVPVRLKTADESWGRKRRRQ
jgi:excisionase family DNA binding protein